MVIKKQESDSMVPKPKPGHTAPGTGEMSRVRGDDLPVEQVNYDQIESRGYRYSGSDDIDEVAWYDGNNEGRIFEEKSLLIISR